MSEAVLLGVILVVAGITDGRRLLGAGLRAQVLYVSMLVAVALELFFCGCGYGTSSVNVFIPVEDALRGIVKVVFAR
ncbi:MAG: hypothetical protein OWT27_01360 [Firmicutes bacterium]|nr:hypothetical protein [Bacillota bacterium]